MWHKFEIIKNTKLGLILAFCEWQKPWGRGGALLCSVLYNAPPRGKPCLRARSCWLQALGPPSPPSCLGFGGAAGAPLGFCPPYVDVSMANSPTSRGGLPVWVPLCSLSSLPIITASGHTPEHLFPSQKLFSALLLVGGEPSYYLQSRVCSMGQPGQQPAGHKTPTLCTNSLQKIINKKKK